MRPGLANSGLPTSVGCGDWFLLPTAKQIFYHQAYLISGAQPVGVGVLATNWRPSAVGLKP